MLNNLTKKLKVQMMSTLLDILLKNSGSLTGAINWKDLGKTLAVAAVMGVGTALATYASGGGAGALAPLLVMASSALIDLAHRYSADNSAAKPATK